VHRVNVDLGKERSWSGNGWRNEEISHLLNLAEVACAKEPCVKVGSFTESLHLGLGLKRLRPDKALKFAKFA
jgi:hypothetical protein